MRKLSLAAKLTFSFVLVALLVSGAGFYLMVQFSSVHAAYQDVATRLGAVNKESSDIKAAIADRTVALYGYMLLKDPKYKTDFQTQDQIARQSLDSMLSLVTDSGDRAVLLDLQAASKEYASAAETVFNLVDQGKPVEATNAVSEKVRPLRIQMKTAAAQLSDKYEAMAIEAARSADAVADRAKLMGYAAFLVSLILALTMGIGFARSISTPVTRVAAAAQRLASGDLTVESLAIASQDEVGKMAAAFDHMAVQLRQFVLEVSGSTQQVTHAAAHLRESSGETLLGSRTVTQSIQSLNAGAAEQAGSTDGVRRAMDELEQSITQIAAGAGATAAEVQQSANLLHEMTATLIEMADNARAVSADATQAAVVAQQGKAVVDSAVASMSRIKDGVGTAALRLTDLESLSNRIGEITTVVSAIAGQTNMLALNAAIEAARAGEHGRGFAVVSEEIRRLAESSSRSTREISGLITDIQDRTRQAVMAMQTGRAEVDEGTRLVTGAGAALEEIHRAVERAAESVEALAVNAGQVGKDADRVVVAFQSVGATTEENSALAEEMAAGAAEALRGVHAVARVAGETAAEANDMSAVAEQLTASADGVANQAHRLAEIARSLSGQVARFKVAGT